MPDAVSKASSSAAHRRRCSVRDEKRRCRKAPDRRQRGASRRARRFRRRFTRLHPGFRNRCRRAGRPLYSPLKRTVEPPLATRHPAQRLPARLPERLRAGGRAYRRKPHRADPRSRFPDLYARRRLRQGRALCRAPAPSRPAVAAVAPDWRQGRRPCRLLADFVGRRARRGRRAADPRRAAPRLRSGVALLLFRHDGAGAARRHQPAAPRDALFARGSDDLQHADRHRLGCRGRRAARRRRARDREIRSDRGLGRQPGLDPGQRDDPCRDRAGASAARSSSSSTRTAPPAPRPPICIWRRCPAPMVRSPAR